MATMNISLPDEMKAFIESQAAAQGFGTVSEYMRALIREAQTRAARRERVDALLLEGLDSGPPTPLVEADWEAIRREIHERHAGRQGTTHGPEDARGR